MITMLFTRIIKANPSEQPASPGHGSLVSGMESRFDGRATLRKSCLLYTSIFAIAPLCGIYYPISTLPGWLQPLSWALPASHVFEGMRSVLLHQTFRADYLLYALLLNAGYLALGVSVFLGAIHGARERGSLLQSGE